MLATGLGAQAARAQTNRHLDRSAAASEFLTGSAAYNGYWNGFARGAEDLKVGLEFIPWLDVTYLGAATGYTHDMGPFATYQGAFRKAYARGYAEARSGRDLDPSTNIPPVPLEPSYGVGLDVHPAAEPEGVSFLSVATATGYSAGYAQGTADNRLGGNYGYREQETHRLAVEGYDPSFGDESRYQYVFRQIYARGYSDGFNGRARYTDDRVQVDEGQPEQALPVESHPDAAARAADDDTSGDVGVPLSPAARQAVLTGYRVGHERGRFDSTMGVRKASPEEQGAYQIALDGWEPQFGERSTYQQEFRKSFLLGYDDGFNGRTPTFVSRPR